MEQVELKPGEWSLWGAGGVLITCPKCGTKGRLNHEIDAAGNVTPSVACPSEACDFHTMVKLLDWKPAE